MPLVSEVPENIKKIDDSSRLIVKSIIPQLEIIGSPQKLGARVELYTQFSEKFVVILKGEFKLMSGDKIVRIFAPNDIFYFSPIMVKNNVRFFCEYSSEVLTFASTMLSSLLLDEPEFAIKWQKWANAQQDLNVLIEAHYLTAGMKPTLEMRSFESGEIIINENDNSEEIFEMMDGSARVVVNNVKVGTVEEGDIFGELSFLTEGKRTASVIAEKSCTVNLIKRADFVELIKYRPQLIYNIARSLAKRILSVNHTKSE